MLNIKYGENEKALNLFIRDRVSWKSYQALDYIKSTIKYRWNWAVDGLGKPGLKFTSPARVLAGRPILAVEETYDLIADRINNKEPFFAGRFGHTELNMIVQVMNVRYGKQEEYEQAALKQLNTNAGFFPENMQLGREFVDLMLRELPYLDLHGIWPLYMEDYTYRDVYLLATAADEDEHAIDGAKKGLEGFIACFERAYLAGCIFAGGVDAPGMAKGHNALEKAREMGKQV